MKLFSCPWDCGFAPDTLGVVEGHIRTEHGKAPANAPISARQTFRYCPQCLGSTFMLGLRCYVCNGSGQVEGVELA